MGRRVKWGVKEDGRFVMSVGRELQFPDSLANPFCITGLFPPQGPKRLAIYWNNYGTQSSRQRRRKEEKGGGGRYEGEGRRGWWKGGRGEEKRGRG